MVNKVTLGELGAALQRPDYYANKRAKSVEKPYTGFEPPFEPHAAIKPEEIATYITDLHFNREIGLYKLSEEKINSLNPYDRLFYKTKVEQYPEGVDPKDRNNRGEPIAYHDILSFLVLTRRGSRVVHHVADVLCYSKEEASIVDSLKISTAEKDRKALAELWESFKEDYNSVYESVLYFLKEKQAKFLKQWQIWYPNNNSVE